MEYTYKYYAPTLSVSNVCMIASLTETTHGPKFSFFFHAKRIYKMEHKNTNDGDNPGGKTNLEQVSR